MAKQTQYQKLDVVPAEGGKSLLHNEFGMLKVRPEAKVKMPPPKEFSDKPVLIKAKRVEPADDDKFLPPKANFAHVGNLDHTWYNDVNIDNNETVDIEAVQGIDPLQADNVGIASLKSFFNKKILEIKEAALGSLKTVQTIEDFEDCSARVFGDGGLFSQVFVKMGNMKPEERVIVGGFVNDQFQDLKFSFDAKYYELASLEEEEPSEDPEEDEFAEDDVDESLDGESEITESSGHISMADLEEGQYLVIVDGLKQMVVESEEEVRVMLSRLLLGNNIEIGRIRVLKRVSIDFGVLIKG
jgi:hypothetical protein